LPSATLRIIAATWLAPIFTLDGDTLTDGVDYLAQPATTGSGGWVVILRPIDTSSVLTITLLAAPP